MLKSFLTRRPAPAPDPHEPWQPDDDLDLFRQLVILRPKMPSLQWVKQIDPDCTLTLAQLRADAVAYLVPLGEGNPAQARAFVDAHYGRFFAQELANWTADTNLWPTERSLDLFRHWFDIEIIDMVLDVANA